VDGLDRSDIHALGGLLGDEQRGVVRELPRDDDLLRVAARQRPDALLRARGAHVELGDELTSTGLLRSKRDPAAADAVAGPDRSGAVVAEGEILGDRHRDGASLAAAVLGNDRDAERATIADTPARDIRAEQCDGAGGERARPEDGLDELVLSVARDAGDAHDLARAYRE
jgi:hypothetical protein